MDTIYSTNRKFNRMFANILSIFVTLAMAIPVTVVAYAAPANSKEPVGYRISLFLGSPEFPPNTPFYISHGFVQSSDDDAIGVYEFQLEVDGILRQEDFKDFWVESGEPDTLQRRWVYNFPEGMTGTHTFTGHWFGPCQAVVEDPSMCPTPNANVEFSTQTLTINFTPAFVAYKPGAIEGYNWPMGDAITININNGEYTTEAFSEQRPDSPEGVTRVLFELWRDNVSINAGDHILMTDEASGFTKDVTVTNLAVTDINLGARTVSGVYDAAYSLWVWLYGEDGQVPATDPTAGTWIATFTELPPGAWGGATQWDTDGDGTSIDFQMPNPHFSVFPEWNYIEAWDWQVGATVTVAIADKPECSAEGVSGHPDWDPNALFVPFWLPEDCDVVVGDMVTLTDGVTIREHTVRNLAITAVNKDTNTITGTADPGAMVHVWPHGYNELLPTADVDGNWMADFTDPGPDLVEGMGGRTEIRDEFGNATAVEWRIPNPWLVAFPESNQIFGNDWPEGSEVSLTINDAYISTVTVGPAPWNPNDILAFFDLGGSYDLKPGDIVALSGSGTVRTHTVQNLTITNVDKVANTVSGTADIGAVVYAWVHGYGETEMQLTVEDGTWLADFGSNDFDLVEGMCGRSEIRDEVGNSTAVDWCIPSPRLIAFPAVEQIFGYNWPEGSEVSLSINGGYIATATVQGAPWDPNDIMAFFDFGGVHDLISGDEVTLSGNGMELTYTVLNLSVTEVNAASNTATGAADDGALVYAGVHGWWDVTEMQLNAENGTWLADFGSLDFDLTEGMCGRAEIRDEFGSSTAVDWCIPTPSNPRIVASITEDWFYLVDFAHDSTVNYSVYESQGGTQIWEGSATTDGSGSLWINADGHWDLEPGNYLVVSDGTSTKDLVVEGFTFDVFDLTQGILQGTAPGPEGRHVWVGIGFENDGWSMDVYTNADSNWVADFGQPVPVDYWWVAAQIFDNDGDASELRPSQIINRTMTAGNFYVEWSTTNPEEVTYLSWKGSPNLASSCTSPNCPGNFEFFGNSWVSENEGTPDFFFASLVGGGTTGSWTQAGTTVDIHSVCMGCWNSADTSVHTSYQFFDDPSKADLIAITRTFEFGETLFAHAIRVFIPRLYPFDGFNQVIYPDVDGNLVVTEAICDFGCQATGWDGSWFAIHNPATGQGVILQRTLSTMAPALWLDWDAASFTNASNFLLLPPAGGFTGTVTETEYLCFYESSTWTPSLTLPEGCQP